jgi:hypothetical protein
MEYGICVLSAVPLRATAADSAEMINQVLFGECFEVLEKQKSWSLIKLQHDGYEGWLDNKQMQQISESYYAARKSEQAACSVELIDIISNESAGRYFPIIMGSYLPFFESGKVDMGHHTLSFGGNCISGEQSRAFMMEMAYQYLGSPYLWGGRTPLGIDCSGFTQMVYRLAGHELPRDSGQQAQLGQTLSFIEEAQIGDLAFFDNAEGKITHVGLMLSDNRIIHASGEVRIDQLDQSGIFNKEKGVHTHRLRVIKSII